jgi:hypothetical protein
MYYSKDLDSYILYYQCQDPAGLFSHVSRWLADPILLRPSFRIHSLCINCPVLPVASGHLLFQSASQGLIEGRRWWFIYNDVIFLTLIEDNRPDQWIGCLKVEEVLQNHFYIMSNNQHFTSNCPIPPHGKRIQLSRRVSSILFQLLIVSLTGSYLDFMQLWPSLSFLFSLFSWPSSSFTSRIFITRLSWE